MSNKFVIVDIETTGSSPKKGDRIIQFAAVVVENGKIIDQYSSLVNPEKTIPVFIEELTGINDEMVEDAPLFSEIAPKVLTILDGAYFVAHNVLFDLSFLQECLIEAGYEGFYGPVLDTVEISRILYPTADSYKLNDLAASHHLSHYRPHQADSDAYVTAELFMIFIGKLHTLPEITLRKLSKLAGGLKSDFSLLLDDILLIKEEKVEELDETIEIYHGLALKRRQIAQELDDPEGKISYPFNHEKKEELIKKAFSSFEKRSGQFQMMDSIFRCFVNNKHGLIEAGTGVGKSLAYLLPTAIFSHERNEKIVISTFTIQLQDQLLSKEIPLLEKMLPFNIKTALLKGRNHYISLAKFVQSLTELDDNYDTTLTKMQILVWLTETETGDNDELNLSSGGQLYWNKIKNDEVKFVQNKEWLSKDFYLKAKKEAQQANIIITNHSLLLSDLVSDHAILPDYEYLVIDEGHHFEKASGKYFGLTLDYLTIRLILNDLGLYEQKHSLYQLEQILSEYVPNEFGAVESFEVNQIMTDLHTEMDEFFRTVNIFARKKTRQSSSNKISSRFAIDEERKEWKSVIISAERFSFLLKDLGDYLIKKIDLLSDRLEQLTDDQKIFLDEVINLIKAINETRNKIKNIIIEPSPENITWIEIDTRAVQNSTTIYARPNSVSGYLKDQLFANKKSVVVTSATLSVNHSFSYLINELGLSSFDCHLEQIPSPFDYKNQVQLIVPNDLPEIKSVSIEEYVAGITEHIISIAEVTKGRMLILFTSHDMLRRTYDLMKESGLLEDYAIIAQGITGGSRTRLTRNFQRFEKAILLGTSSFWEGIDIPGEDLSCLIIVRLPFSPPDDPITEGKSQDIKEGGGNPFTEFALPEAVIRFKQGFGRLIRTHSDRGVIVVFDKRIVTTRYGKAFLQSIPAIPVKNIDLNETVEFIESWL